MRRKQGHTQPVGAAGGPCFLCLRPCGGGRWPPCALTAADGRLHLSVTR